ncbi:MAG TPA: hypothetical protein VF072_06335 [Thermoleophilaceae bacterium]
MKTYSGWVIFAAVMLIIAGVLNVIWGIAAIADSKFFIQDQKYILSNLNLWGWITLIIGALQLLAGFSLWSGNLYGRVMAILFASLSALAALLSIPAYPFWSLAIFALDIIIIYQVSLYGGAGVENEDRDPARVQAARRDVVR